VGPWLLLKTARQTQNMEAWGFAQTRVPRPGPGKAALLGPREKKKSTICASFGRTIASPGARLALRKSQ